MQDRESYVQEMKNSMARQLYMNAGKLLTGTGIAQALALLAAPVISRIFTPVEMGVFGAFLATVSILGVVSTLRYENAVLLPESPEDAAAIAMGVCICAIMFSLVVAAVLLIGGEPVLAIVGLSSISFAWLVVPFSVALMGCLQGANIFAVRQKWFGRLAFSRVMQSGSTAGSQIGAGSANMAASGLILGQVLGQLFGLLVILVAIARIDRAVFRGFSVDNVRKLAKRYVRFPLFSLPADFVNMLTNFLPYFILGAFFGPASVGFYTFTQRIMAGPIALFGNAVLEVFKERASQDYRNKGSCRDLFRHILFVLSLLSIPPTIVLALYAPDLFAWIFGETWRDSGVYARLLLPLMMFRFVGSPLGYVFYIAEKQNIDLAWQVVLMVGSVASLVIGGFMFDEYVSIAVFSIFYSVMYIFYIIIAYRYAEADNLKGASK